MTQSRNLKDAKRKFKIATIKCRYSVEDRFLDACITEYLTYEEALELLKYAKTAKSLEFILEDTRIIEGYLESKETYKQYV